MTPRPGPRLASALALLALTAAPVAAQIPAAGDPGGLPPDDPLRTTLVAPPFGHTLGIDRARPAHLDVFLGGRTEFDDPQGLAAVKFASDDDPAKTGDDYQLTLFGVNTGRGEVIYNSSMRTLAIYGGTGAGEGRFRAPHGIAATPDGRVYVADTGNRRIARLRWTPRSRSLAWAGEWPAASPFDVAVDTRGQAWVSDRERNAVVRYADDAAGAGGNLLPPSPVAGEAWPVDDVEAPLGLAVGDSLDPWYGPDAYRLYLVDRDGARLRAVDADGRVLATVTPTDVAAATGRAAGFFYVALDHFGNVYVTDPGAGAVHKLDPALRPLATFPGSGAPDGAIEEPRGIAIWRRFGQVFVAEREGARYYFLGTDFVVDEPLAVRDEGTTWAFDLFLSEAATLRVAFLDAAGDTLAVAETAVHDVGPVTARWGAWTSAPADGWRERAVTASVEARPTYSSRKKFSRLRTLPMAVEQAAEAARERPSRPRPGPS